MRNQWARRVVVGLILAFPLLLCLVASPRSTSLTSRLEAVPPLIAVETVVVGGLLFARRERRRLRMELDAATTLAAIAVPRPSGSLVKAKAPAWRPVSGSPGL